MKLCVTLFYAVRMSVYLAPSKRLYDRWSFQLGIFDHG